MVHANKWEKNIMMDSPQTKLQIQNSRKNPTQLAFVEPN